MTAQQEEDFKAFRASMNGHHPELVGSLASAVEPERVTWLWSGRLALGKISMLDGNPGLGKSTLLLDIAARVTTGEPFPGQVSRREAAGVVVLSAEDGIADTIVPRLTVAGANLDRVFILRGVKALDGTELGITIPANLDVVAEAVTTIGAALVILDPLMAYFGPEINANRDQDVRRALAPLAALLEEHRAAAWLIRHLTKGESKEALYRGGGSIGIIGAARFGTMVARDPDNPDARIVAATKCNLGPEPPSLRYGLEGVEGTDVARVVWDGEPARWTAMELLDDAVSEQEKQERSESEQWLWELLTEGPCTYSHVMREGKKAGFGDRTLKRAKVKIGGHSRREGGIGSDGNWIWELVPSSSLRVHQSPDTPILSDLSPLSPKSGPLSSSSSSYVNTLSRSDGFLVSDPSAKDPLRDRNNPKDPKNLGVSLSDTLAPWEVTDG